MIHSELRNALLSLNTLSNSTTRRLDMTYYSVLEKLSTLQNTIASLKELANMTRKLNDDFKVESEEVVTDINAQLTQFSDFDDQQARIEALALRVQAGRQKIKTLGSRVDIVQDRVTCWELAEKEWKDKTRKRLRIMWTVIFVFLFIFVGLMVFQNYAPVKTQSASPFRGMNTSGLLGKMPDMEMMENETWTLKRKTEDKLDELRNHSQGPLQDDPRLRIFDEL
jgi:predicted nucleic acid-binding Zn ribbon protein